MGSSDFRQQMVHESSLCYNGLTLCHFCIVNKCQMLTSNKLEKCVHSVVLFVFNISKLLPNKNHSCTALNFCFHLKKTVAESYDYFEKLILNMLHRKIRMKDGFGVSKMVISRLQTKNMENGQTIRRCGIASVVR